MHIGIFITILLLLMGGESFFMYRAVTLAAYKEHECTVVEVLKSKCAENRFRADVYGVLYIKSTITVENELHEGEGYCYDEVDCSNCKEKFYPDSIHTCYQYKNEEQFIISDDGSYYRDYVVAILMSIVCAVFITIFAMLKLLGKI